MSMDPSDYRFQLEVFEGPLDLLLFLIKKNEVEIADIPIVKITEQYLAYLDLMRELNLDVAGEFLVMAATLAHIKSRMLLPMPVDEDEEEEGDPREELVRRLLEYRKYKEAASALSARPVLGRDTWPRGPAFEKPAHDEADEPVAVDASLFQLLEALKGVLDDIPQEAYHEVDTETASVTEQAQWLGRILAQKNSVAFHELFRGASRRVDVVVTFLAILEMARMQVVRIYQAEAGGAIRVASRVPHGVNPAEAVGSGELEKAFAYDPESVGGVDDEQTSRS